jgi:CRP/FNR family cyclic AMP-dependent transcriptional regulator
MTQPPRTTEELLSGIDLFSDLSGRQLRKLAGLTKETQHEAGREVAAEGRNALGFHLILSGDATVMVGTTKVRDLHAGDYFGEISMIDGKPRSATVTASTPLNTVVLPHHVFQQLVEDEPAFARGLLTTLCARLREAQSVV